MSRGQGRRYKAQREKFCQALAQGMSAIEAGRAAGYRGSANARRNSQRVDVKARVAELQAPGLAKVQEAIDRSVEAWVKHYAPVVFKPIDLDEVEYSEQLRTGIEWCKVNGFYAPERQEVTGARGGPVEMISRKMTEKEAQEAFFRMRKGLTG